MEKKAILMDEKDNVATCSSEAQPEDMVICHGGGRAKVRAIELIPIWHKIALKPIAKGEMVYKYGEIIGETLRDIPQGGWVSHENIRSIPRDYASEYVMGKEGK